MRSGSLAGAGKTRLAGVALPVWVACAAARFRSVRNCVRFPVILATLQGCVLLTKTFSILYLYQREAVWSDRDKPASQARLRLSIYFAMFMGDAYSIIAP